MAAHYGAVMSAKAARSASAMSVHHAAAGLRWAAFHGVARAVWHAPARASSNFFGTAEHNVAADCGVQFCW